MPHVKNFYGYIRDSNEVELQNLTVKLRIYDTGNEIMHSRLLTASKKELNEFKPVHNML